MEPRSDRLLRRVWLVNGFLLLALGVLALTMILWTLVRELLPHREPSVRVAKAEGGTRPLARAVRFDEPVRILGTPVLLARVRHGEADEPEAAYASYGSAEPWAGRGRTGGALVNVIFLLPGEPRGRLLLDRPAYIGNLRFPDASEREIAPYRAVVADSLPPWISYEIADRDSNGDGVLDSKDDAALYVSALDGTGLRRVLPEPFRLVSHAHTADRRSLVVLALEPPRGRPVPPERMRQRAFLYEVATGRLTPFVALEAAAAQAARVVGRAGGG